MPFLEGRALMQTLPLISPKTEGTGPGLVRRGLSTRETIVWILVASAAFHAAYLSAATAFLVVICLFALVQSSRAESWRRAFYAGLSVGLLIAVGRLDFFWHIFSIATIVLWLVYAF